MGHPRASRRKAVVLTSDEEDDECLGLENILSDTEEEAGRTRSTSMKTTGNTRANNVAQSGSSTTSKLTSKSTPPTSQSHSTKVKSKTAKASEVKRGNKSIHSFFNAATQRQQLRPSASPEKLRPSQHDTPDDILDDISGDDTSVPFSKGSETALALRKRKLQNDQFDPAGYNAPSAPTQKFRKISDERKVPAKDAVPDRRPWTEQFAPADLSELAVHKKKVQDVRNVLESAFSNRAMPRLIVLKGPAGSAKTATVNMLAKDFGAEIVEWKNPAGADGSSAAYVSVSAQFDDFVLRSGQYAGLQLVTSDAEPTVDTAHEIKEDKPQIMVIEEFPNTFARASTVLQSFRATLQQFLATPRSSISKPTPLVMIVSETLLSTSTASADSFTAHRLLGPQILTHPLTAEIEFNPVATTILTKALELIVVKEARKSGRRKTPGPQVLKHIAETGDIRSAVSSLEFLCVKGDEGDMWSSRVAFTKPKSGKREAPLTKQEQEALKLISNREISLGIFHAVGKVVYNKRQDPDPAHPVPQPPNHLPQHCKPKVPEVDVDVLINELGTDTSTFIAALHENYALSCNSSSSEDALDSLNGCIDALSDADLLSLDHFGFGTRAYSGSVQDNLRQDDMSFQTAVRGLLFSLPSPVHRGDSGAVRGGGAFRMLYPQSLRIWKRQEEIKDTLDLVIQSLQTRAGAINDSRSSEKKGVESWKRSTDFNALKPKNTPEPLIPSDTAECAVEREDESASSALLPIISASAKNEMLLDRLPYTAQILSRPPNNLRSLLSKIETLTSLHGDIEAPTSLQDAGVDEDASDSREDLPHWRKPGLRKKQEDMEGGGLHIPVEHSVEKLVLSDDDIED